MNSLTIAQACFTLATVAALCGCASRSQLAKLSAEKEQLVAAIGSEKKLNLELASKLQSSTDRAAEAERELALLHGGQPRSATLVNTPVRSSSSGSASLEQWSRSQPLLKYDARQRAARVNLDLQFDTSDYLTLDSRRSLDKIADSLSPTSTARYGVRITGIEAQAGDVHALPRAEHVAKYLRDRGLKDNRLSVVTRGGTALVDEEGRKLGGAAKTVELEIVELPGAPNAVANENGGWTASDRR